MWWLGEPGLIQICLAPEPSSQPLHLQYFLCAKRRHTGGWEDTLWLGITPGATTTVWEPEGYLSSPLWPLFLCPQDQVDHLLALKVRVSSLNSKLSAQEKKELLSDLEQEKPWTKILYITPEMAAAASFQPTLNSLVSRTSTKTTCQGYQWWFLRPHLFDTTKSLSFINVLHMTSETVFLLLKTNS